MDMNLIKCEACLCSDRRLVYISKIQSIIKELQISEIVNSNGAICWECHRYMIKYYRFKAQINQAQEVLSRYIETQQHKSLSSLTKTTKQNYDYEYTYYDPLITEVSKKEILDEPNMIKQENDDEVNSTDYDKPLKVFADTLKITKIGKDKKRFNTNKRSLKQDKKKIKENILKKKQLQKEYIQIETNNSKDELKYRKENLKHNIKNKNTKKVKLKDTDINAKFNTVLFTEEEMLGCREEKRNQANFKKIPFKCDSCVIGFTKKENYDLHLIKKHDENIGIHTCSVCQCRFPSKTALSRHETKHYINYCCQFCTYKVSSKTAAMNHCRNKHAEDEENSIHCKQCTFVARTTKELSEHTRADHMFVCECGVKFKGRNTLRAHKVRIECSKRQYSCGVCARTFSSVSRREAHAARHGGDTARRLAYCVPCRVQYKDIHVYRSHLRNSMHHVQDRVKCPQCDKRFASRVYWSKHFKFYHLRQSRYKCLICDKIFISEWRLKIHKQVHHGLARTRDHACTVCGKKFYSKASLHSHSVVHVSTRTYMCARCGDTFRQRAALHSHTKLLHQDI